MFRVLLAALIIVPALDIVGIIVLGRYIGGWATFGFLLLTGFLGIYLARREARKVMDYARFQLSKGQMPTASLLDGACVFVGGILLVLPGLITDILGFLLIFPYTRPIFKALLLLILQRQIARGRFSLFFRK
ncbi:FxsA family protein [Paenibacillus eucommiae]|uniref:UPF0716 protein FxsA n=1 Tax=Paenibacillus eucommiae TaxID=1355755 RepID=A0ABS4J1X7_9BACL|nr:FxsA family protein [Paenibacillus eucommiae]MBP1993256.1 UPF0716 protein FxsA [Paenibacillus eucommiae]